MINKTLTWLMAMLIFASCSDPAADMRKEIEGLEKSIFADSIKTPDQGKARELTDLYRVFAEKFPTDTAAPEYLFRAGDLAQGVLKNPNEAIQYYEKVCKDFPRYSKVPLALFIQGFILENKLMKIEPARKKYLEFIEKYPNHTLAKDVQFSLQFLGKSGDELIKMFESMNSSDSLNPPTNLP